MTAVILINTGIGNCGFNSYGKGIDESWINHGLASIGAFLTANKCDFKYLDLRKYKNWSHFSRAIAKEKPKIIGISATTVDYDIAARTAEIIKEFIPDAKVVFGGIHASVCPDQCITQNNFDHVIIGEGELTFYKLINAHFKTRIIKAEPIQDLDKLPFIDRNVFGNSEISLYPRILFEPFCTFIASRGCPYNCSFCQPAEKILFGTKIRTRSPENLVKEIKTCIINLGMNSYLLHDDCMLWDINWLSSFTSNLQKRHIKIPFAIQSRSDLICKFPKEIKRLTKVGLKMILIGFESGSQKILDFLNKGTTVEQNLKAADICENLNIAIWANYMFGIPGETKSDIKATVKMIKTIQPEVYSPSFFTPYPGSYLHDYCQERGLSLINQSADFRRDPKGKKIKGVDYGFLKKAVRMSMSQTALIYFLKKVKHKCGLILKNLIYKPGK